MKSPHLHHSQSLKAAAAVSGNGKTAEQNHERLLRELMSKLKLHTLIDEKDLLPVLSAQIREEQEKIKALIRYRMLNDFGAVGTAAAG